MLHPEKRSWGCAAPELFFRISTQQPSLALTRKSRWIRNMNHHHRQTQNFQSQESSIGFQKTVFLLSSLQKVFFLGVWRQVRILFPKHRLTVQSQSLAVNPSWPSEKHRHTCCLNVTRVHREHEPGRPLQKRLPTRISHRRYNLPRENATSC
jgi:hypothetical protein